MSRQETLIDHGRLPWLDSDRFLQVQAMPSVDENLPADYGDVRVLLNDRNPVFYIQAGQLVVMSVMLGQSIGRSRHSVTVQSAHPSEDRGRYVVGTGDKTMAHDRRLVNGQLFGRRTTPGMGMNYISREHFTLRVDKDAHGALVNLHDEGSTYGTFAHVPPQALRPKYRA